VETIKPYLDSKQKADLFMISSHHHYASAISFAATMIPNQPHAKDT
jgi:hypothetical protein